jgi:hypothetical protein
VSIISEPRSFAEAINGPYERQWREAALEEIITHISNGTWTVMKLPPGQKAIGLK